MATTYSRAGKGLASSVSAYTIFTEDEAGQSQSVDNLLFDTRYAFQWGSGIGHAVELTTSFSSSRSLYNYTFEDGAALRTASFSQEQQAAALGAMAAASMVCGVRFTVVAESDTTAGDIRWANSLNLEAVPTARGNYPGGAAMAGDIWFGGAAACASTPGTYGYYCYLHELSHALGLNHPHEGTVAPLPGEDQLKYSVTSYRDHDGDLLDDGIESAFLPTTFMLNDVAALQALYGANLGFHAGNDVYRWASGTPVFETVWDGGGIDTIDASNQMRGVRLDLTAGHWSEIGPAFFNGETDVRDCLAIAYGCSIENAVGSSYADTLLGNDAANMLAGRGGADVLDGADGNDTLEGGAGNDALSGGAGIDAADFNGTGASYSISFNVRTLTASVISTAEGNDRLSGVERLNFNDGALALDLYGNAGIVAKVLGVMGAGAAGLVDTRQVGMALRQVDAGMSASQLVEQLADAALGPQHSHADFVQLVWRNVFNDAVPWEQQALWIGLLDSGTFSEGMLGAAVAESAQNLVNIDFAGLMQTGLDYL